MADSSSRQPVSIKELRLGLVCYGGVSLAVYMHGITKEIHNLVRASAAFVDDSAANPFEPTDTARVYWDFLQAQALKDGARTRVVVDVISGTSAGGINGVVLAKCLAHNLSQDSLRAVWLEKGNIFSLLGHRITPVFLKKMGYAIGKSITDFFGMNPPLQPYKDYMFGWLYDALGKMEPYKTGGASLMPPGHTLELFVTATDFQGYEQRLSSSQHIQQATDCSYRHVFRFSYKSGERDQFNRSYDPLLGFAARATSSFPIAFPSIRLATVYANEQKHWLPLAAAEKEFFRRYQLASQSVPNREYIDGGVLDNYPFGHCIDAIVRRPASLEVDRRLLYIEPHPELSQETNETEPNWLQRTAAGIQSKLGFISSVKDRIEDIRAHEPILDEFMRVQRFNERVRLINEIVDENFDRIQEHVFRNAHAARALTGANKYEVEAVRDQMHNNAINEFGLAYSIYARIKLTQVIETIARVVSKICGYPPDSRQASLIGDIVHEQAARIGLFEKAVRPTPTQVDFLKTFDLGYSLRRIRFVIQGINQLYDRAGQPSYPSREQIDLLKSITTEMADRLRFIMGGGGLQDKEREELLLLFGEESLKKYIDLPNGHVLFLKDHGADIGRFIAQFGSSINRVLSGFGEEFLQRCHGAVAFWHRDTIKNLLVRYLGFPFWDALIYPIRILGDVGELKEIQVLRMSPDDVFKLSPRGAKNKLKGIALGHFNAFVRKSFRENDYLWGRLDAAERLITLLAADADVDAYKQAFSSIIEGEEATLKTIGPLIENLKKQVNDLTAP
ncbi:MAG TPA: hypothetical protein DCZ95_02795 [Verrucomicrobia bacterium]|nr:MAG: hypothetical protein A2X46_14860 [Lentisphaerae bacterium GWF2_57_35]HBA83000.1 hypothetical protein [Verrucomicrobiota bacterium]